MTSEPPHGLDARSWVVAGGRPGAAGGPLNTPPILASNFLGGSEYSRSSGTDTWRSFEEIVGGLERGRAIAFSSGMAAISAVFAMLASGSHIVLPDDCYHGVVTLAAEGARLGRWTVARIPTTDTAAWLAALERADLVWLESPSNPLLEIAELRTICGASRPGSCRIAVDNTFSTPLNLRPIELGADITVHSATKWLGGHADLLLGVAVAASEETAGHLERIRATDGATPGALETYLATRGIRTLAVRLERSQHNAGVLAERLAAHPAVRRVRYPGLTTHPGHDVASAEMDGFGGVISFEMQDATAADQVCARVRLVNHATSLGGVESCLERRAGLPGQEHIPAGLIRLSVGIEDVEDLWRDLAQAMG